jgi:hypothetical protein
MLPESRSARGIRGNGRVAHRRERHEEIAAAYTGPASSIVLAMVRGPARPLGLFIRGLMHVPGWHSRCYVGAPEHVTHAWSSPDLISRTIFNVPPPLRRATFLRLLPAI